MSIKRNEFGEVISVNGITTGQHLGTPMQDALGTDEENSAYGEELATVTRVGNTIDDKQPESNGGSGGSGGSGGDTSIEDGLITRSLTEYSNSRVTEIGAGAFLGSRLKEIYFPNVTTIKRYGFFQAIELSSVTDEQFPSLTKIGSDAFSGCTELQTVELSKVEEIESGAFRSCNYLQRLSLPNVHTLSNDVFYNCRNLTKINLPSVKTIGVSCFENCDGLTEIVLPKVQFLPDGSFYECARLEKVDLYVCSEAFANAFKDCSSLTTMILRNTETVCMCDETALEGTKINGVDGFAYIPSSMWDAYTIAYGDYIAIFRKIEDYPEVTGG